MSRLGKRWGLEKGDEVDEDLIATCVGRVKVSCTTTWPQWPFKTLTVLTGLHRILDTVGTRQSRLNSFSDSAASFSLLFLYHEL
jgi:hypothetical protein